MNFSEFRRWLNSDPASQDADYQAARTSAPEFIHAATASDEFERKLLLACRLDSPADLAKNLEAIAQGAPAIARKQPFYWGYAMAASLLLAVAAVILKQQLVPQFESVEDYVAYHYAHDGYQVLGLAGKGGNSAPGPDELKQLLAGIDLQINQPLSGRVRFVKYCPTPQGRGIHLVMDTDQGPVTVVFMPGQQVQDGELFAFDGVEASLVSFPGMSVSAAIIGQPGQLDPALGLALQAAVGPSVAGT